MTIASQIRQSEDYFKFTQKLITSLSEKFNFSHEEAWSHISPSKSVENLQRHFKRERKRNDPLSQVKKPRTAFSFFTQEHRPKVQASNPTASFGDLSRLVSVDWKKLSDKQLKRFKEMETVDKERYNVERSRVLSEIAESTSASETSASTTTAAPAPSQETSTASESKKSRSKSSSKKASSGTTSTASTASTASQSAPAQPSKPKKKSSGKRRSKAPSATATASS